MGSNPIWGSDFPKFPVGSIVTPFISFNTILSPKRNWKQCLCKMWGDTQRVLWYFPKWPIDGMQPISRDTDRVVFNWVSKVISELLWFCITSLSGWFKVFAPLFQPIRSETKTNCGSRVHIFPRFVSATCNYFEFWLVYWICLRPFWLAKVITLVLVLRHSFENRSNNDVMYNCWRKNKRS